LPDFTRFKRVFESHEPDRQVPEWRDLVWTYIKNPDIPIVAFERVAEQFPLRVEKVLRLLIGDKDFSLEHMYAVLLHYKQPVDGLEDLKDDQHLWDLFNGNPPPDKSRKAAGQTPKPRAGAKAAQKRPRSKMTAKHSAKKTVANKRSTSASGFSRKPATKLSPAGNGKAASRRAAPSAKKRSAKGTSAKKR